MTYARVAVILLVPVPDEQGNRSAYCADYMSGALEGFEWEYSRDATNRRWLYGDVLQSAAVVSFLEEDETDRPPISSLPSTGETWTSDRVNA